MGALPRRIAHVVHALMEAQGPYAFGQMPLRAGEVVVYDGEATTARQTGNALKRARTRGLVMNAGSLWFPLPHALERKREFEERYLNDTEESR